MTFVIQESEAELPELSLYLNLSIKSKNVWVPQGGN